MKNHSRKQSPIDSSCLPINTIMTVIPDLFKRAGNQALSINPPYEGIDIHLTEHGSDWLWAVFALFACSAVVNAGIFSFTRSKDGNGLKKSFFVYPLFIHAVLAYAYFTYASNLGYASQETEFHHVTTDQNLNVRQIFYAKYIGWFLLWPFLLGIFEISTHTLEYTSESANVWTKLLTLLQGLVAKFLATEVFVLGLLIGSLIALTYKWGYFTFAVTAQLFAISLIAKNVFNLIKVTRGRNWSHSVILFEFVVWILYPISWGLSEGGNVIQPDSEAVFYGVLDLVNFLIIPTILTWLNVNSVDDQFFNKLTHKSADPEKLIGETPRASGDTAVPQATEEQA